MSEEFTVDAALVSLVPVRVVDPAEALTFLERDGAVVLASETLAGVSPDDVPSLILGTDLLFAAEPVPVRAAGGQDDAAPGVVLDEAHLQRMPLHNDGFAYGIRRPDHLVLLCEQAAPSGGESFVVDVDALLGALSTSPSESERELAVFLTTTPVDRTELGGVSSIGPVIETMTSGRRALMMSVTLAPAESDPDPEGTRAQIARWNRLLSHLGDGADRFLLAPGEGLWIDNLRMLHARDAYGDSSERLLWRIWAWSTSSIGIPDGPIASDTRYALDRAART